jgi:hypothetical protein
VGQISDLPAMSLRLWDRRFRLSVGTKGGNLLRGLHLRSSRIWSRSPVFNGVSSRTRARKVMEFARLLPSDTSGFAGVRGGFSVVLS